MQAVQLRDLKIGDFVEYVDREPAIAPVSHAFESDWFVVKTMAQQDLTTVGRLHELGLELFVPVIRRRIKTGKIGKNGHKTTRIIAKPLFAGYGFLRTTGITDHRKIEDVRGVQDFMRDIYGNPVRLPHEAVMAVFQTQNTVHQDFLKSGSRGAPKWKSGDKVRIDSTGGVYAGLMATVEWANSKGNIGVLLGMARIQHTLPADMVVVA